MPCSPTPSVSNIESLQSSGGIKAPCFTTFFGALKCLREKMNRLSRGSVRRRSHSRSRLTIPHGLRCDTFYMIYKRARQRALKPLTAGHLIAAEKTGIGEYLPRAQTDRKLSSRASKPIEGNFAVRVNRNFRH